MAITHNTYKKITDLKEWIKKNLPSIYDDTLSYTDLVTKLLEYVNDLVINDGLLSEDVLKLFDSLNSLLNKDFITNEGLTQLKTELERKIKANSDEITSLQTLVDANTDSITSLNSKVTTNTINISSLNTRVNTNATNITATNAKIDDVMDQHKANIKSTITGAMENITKES